MNLPGLTAVDITRMEAAAAPLDIVQLLGGMLVTVCIAFMYVDMVLNILAVPYVHLELTVIAGCMV